MIYFHLLVSYIFAVYDIHKGALLSNTNSNKLSVIILANETSSALFKATGHKTKALIPIHGKPMLDWVIDSFRANNKVGDIYVAGTEELERCAGMRHVTQRIPLDFNPMQNIFAAADLVKTLVQNETSNHDGYLITFCDALSITTPILDEAITNIIDSNADFHLHYVNKKLFSPEYQNEHDRWIPVNDELYHGSSLYYLRSFSQIKGLLETIGEIHRSRFEAKSILQVVGEPTDSLSVIEGKLSKRIGATMKISVSDHPELGMGITTEHDLENIRSIKKSPWDDSHRRGVIIYNPNAGSGRAPSPVMQHVFGIKKRKFDDNRNRSDLMIHAKEYLKELGVDIELWPTNSQGHATELAREAVQKGYELIIAAGGDGTINEVINGMAESSSVLGVLAMGTVNVFALEMNLPSEIEAACEVIAEGKITTIDLGKAGDRYFSCMAGTGFDAHVIKKADSKLKRILGVLAYPITAIAEIITYPFKKITVLLDDQPIPRKGYWVIISNGKYYGGKIQLATFADMSDGYLDVTIFKYRGVLPALMYTLGILKNRTSQFMSIEQFQCKRIRIEKGRNTSLHVDAEYLCEAPIEITAVPASLRVIQ